jgi:ATP-dependent RNA helicase RhlE
MSFSTLGLPETILQGVYASGYNTPTEIQRKAIPLALEGRDVIGCAPTGTGKTAAFVLPILSHLLQNPIKSLKSGAPRVLVLTPTRELALQIEEAVSTYGTYTDIQSTAIFGGVSIVNQLRALKEGVDVVIATPGRLLDHLQRHSITLAHVEYFVLDEADRMYDMGFIKDVRAIAARVPERRQTLLFSATMSREIRAMVSELQHSPSYIEIGVPFSPAELVEQHFINVPQTMKLDLLVHMLLTKNVDSMIVFSRTKHGADRIDRRLQREGITSEALHADRTQSQRQKALDGFKQRDFQVLVATDVAARGIDIDRVACVVNFDAPAFAEDYIHRIGRTGRAESKGMALTFVSEDEKNNIKRIEFLIGKQCPLEDFPGFHIPVQVKEPAEDVPAYLQRKRKYYKKPVFATR